MAEDLIAVLTRFHREVLMPGVVRLIDERLDDRIGGLRNEMLSHFDAVYGRFDRLEAEYHFLSAQYQSLSAAVARLER